MTRCLLISPLLLLWSLSTGCQTVADFAGVASVADHEPTDLPIQKVVAIWQAAEGVGLDGQPARGFAGQIFFFTHDEAPVAVDGDVTISLRDEWSGLTQESKALHDFVFKGPAWGNYLRTSNLGPAYYVFVPYPREGTHRAKCSLRVTYGPSQSASGLTTLPSYSELTEVVLPGTAPTEEMLQARHATAKPVPVARITHRQPAAKSAPQPAQHVSGDRELQRLIGNLRAEQQRQQLRSASTAAPTSSSRPTRQPLQIHELKRFRLTPTSAHPPAAALPQLSLPQTTRTPDARVFPATSSAPAPAPVQTQTATPVPPAEAWTERMSDFSGDAGWSSIR